MVEQSIRPFGGETTAFGAEDARHIAELSLGLRNLSFALTEFVGGGSGTDLRVQDGAMFALYRQISVLSARLDDVSRNCASIQSAADAFNASAAPRPAGSRCR